MTHPFERRTYSFILRLWQEPGLSGEGNSGQWRGQIEPVGGGEKAYFQVPAGLLDFLTAHLPGVGTPIGSGTGPGPEGGSAEDQG